MAILHPKSMGTAMVNAGPIVRKTGLSFAIRGLGGASISTGSIATDGIFLGERLKYRTGALRTLLPVLISGTARDLAVSSVDLQPVSAYGLKLFSLILNSP